MNTLKVISYCLLFLRDTFQYFFGRKDAESRAYDKRHVFYHVYIRKEFGTPPVLLDGQFWHYSYKPHGQCFYEVPSYLVFLSSISSKYYSYATDSKWTFYKFSNITVSTLTTIYIGVRTKMDSTCNGKNIGNKFEK